MSKIAPCLWFNTEAEEAVNFYVSVFKDSRILDISRYGDTGPAEPGSVLAMNFELAGQKFMALNGGTDFPFSEAVSFFYECDSQQEIDEIWGKILENGGQEQQCGWIKDKYGLPWQVVPKVLGEMMSDPDPEKAQRAMAAMMQMVKLDIPTLQKAYEGV